MSALKRAVICVRSDCYTSHNKVPRSAVVHDSVPGKQLVYQGALRPAATLPQCVCVCGCVP